MLGKKEANHKIDGIDSWIHCINYQNLHPNRNKKRVDYHYHEYIELLYFYEGEGNIWINGNKSDIIENSLVIINSNTAHDVFITKPTSYICIKFSPSILYDNEAFFLNFKYAYPFTSKEQNYVLDYEQIKESSISILIDEIIKEWIGMEYGFELAIRANILKIFTTILRLYKNSGYIPTNNNITNGIRNAILYIESNYSTVTEKDVADLCKFSYNYFSGYFKSVVGVSFKDYVHRIRLSEAEKMLLTSDKNITEIAQETGFCTTSHFISVFKKEKGITPLQFKKLSKK